MAEANDPERSASARSRRAIMYYGLLVSWYVYIAQAKLTDSTLASPLISYKSQIIQNEHYVASLQFLQVNRIVRQ
jgi:hypothetical protein